MVSLIDHRLSAFGQWLLAIGFQPVAISYQLSAISYQGWGGARKILVAMFLVCSLGQHVYAEEPSPPAFEPTPVAVPDTGVWLVASREMPDPRFQRTVILLLKHGREGTLGLVINRPAEVQLPDVLSELKGAGERVFWGGPVAMYEPLILVRGASSSEPFHPVVGDWSWGDGQLVLAWLLGRGESVEEWRVYLGHTGWAPGQLDAEMATGSWKLFKADPGALFRQDPDGLWEAFMKKPRWIMAGA